MQPHAHSQVGTCRHDEQTRKGHTVSMHGERRCNPHRQTKCLLRGTEPRRTPTAVLHCGRFALEQPCRAQKRSHGLHHQRAGQRPHGKRQSTSVSMWPLLSAGGAPHAPGGANSLLSPLNLAAPHANHCSCPPLQLWLEDYVLQSVLLVQYWCTSLL